MSPLISKQRTLAWCPTSTFRQSPLRISQTLRVVSLEPEIAVFESDILRHRTVDVWPRRVWTHWLRVWEAVVSPTIRQRSRYFGHSPCCQIPYANIPIAAAADENIIPRNHGPDAHNMAL